MFLIFFLGNLAFLRNQPQFQQLRQVVAQNPQALEPLLQQIGAANPALMQLIVENQQEFMQMLAGDDFEGGAGPGQQVIEVTPEEKEAIERVCQAFFFFVFNFVPNACCAQLERLGFERSKVLEAYLACDKNEALAANYLFDNMNEED